MAKSVWAHRRQQRRQVFLEGIKKLRGCVDCGYNLHAIALEFDHRGDDKLKAVSQMTSHTFLKLLAEIAKCDVVCSNCHRVRTLTRKQFGNPAHKNF